MPICPLIAQDAIVIPDISLLVTTFSRQSWPLQRIATRVTSMVTFVDRDAGSVHAEFMPLPARPRNFPGASPAAIVPRTGSESLERTAKFLVAMNTSR